MADEPLFQQPSEANQALDKETRLPMTGWQQEVNQGLEYGLEAAESIRDRTIPTFSRGELPHYAGINTFLKAPYLEDVRQVGNYDVAIVGVPHDSGTTYRPGTRFGPQGIRKISALYTPYNFEFGVDLREQITLCDVGDIFTIPANNEKSFDQISKGIAHIFSSGAFPIILGGDHSIGFPTVRGSAVTWGTKRSASSTSIAMWTPRKRTWMSVCTPAPGSTPPIWRMPPPKTWCSWALAAGRCPVRG
jgi:agmatinase